MLIIPAIDLLNGQVVRLKQGNYNKKTVYSNDPVAIAKKFASQGTVLLHIVDLDGARIGEMRNLKHILAIRKAVQISLQVGGGVRSIETVDYLLKNGIARVVLGTKAITNKKFLSAALERFGSEKIAVSLDVKDGMPMLHGWKEDSLETVRSLLKFFKGAGLSYLIYTDIIRDGMQTGPNFDALKKIRKYGFKLIASGGVSSLEDVQQLEEMRVYGRIIGRAMYENNNFLNNANQTDNPLS